MTERLGAAIPLLLMTFLIACDGALLGASGASPASPPHVASQQQASSSPAAVDGAATVIVARDDPALPPGCRPGEVAARLMAFFDAFNRGDQRSLAGFFGPEFKWYTVSDPRPSFVTFGTAADATARANGHRASPNRDDLLAYFAGRHRQQERLQLQAVAVAATSAREYANLNFVALRQAADLPADLEGPEHPAAGKGVLTCASQTIAVWSMGTAPPDGQGSSLVIHPCPEPAGHRQQMVVVACAQDNGQTGR